uniref:Uncharacterized protein n=1 Tax=Tetraselmis sp. GSL018 TaxID=582737 RepID=A0A061QR49_9CHLO
MYKVVNCRKYVPLRSPVCHFIVKDTHDSGTGLAEFTIPREVSKKRKHVRQRNVKNNSFSNSG